MDQYLTLNDGTEIKNSHALESMNDLFIYISDPEYDIRKAFETLIESDANSKIVYHYFGTEIPFDGFEKLVAIREELDGSITVTLRKVN